MNFVWLIFPLAVLFALLLGSIVHGYARSRGDEVGLGPFSIYATPALRNGGVIIVMTFLLGLLVLFVAGAIDPALAIALLGAGLLVVMVEFSGLTAVQRVLTHFAAAAWALLWLGGPPAVPVLDELWQLRWIGWGLFALYLVLLVNVHHQMDGIDGYAAAGAGAASVGGAILFWFAGAVEAQAVPSFQYLADQPAMGLMLLACTLFGFLIWNFPPAKVLMGRVGSGFLGITLGVFSLNAAWVAPALFWSWLILLGVFIVDATLTLLRRLRSVEQVNQPPPRHAYQVASRHYRSYRAVILGVAAINLLWLLPIALAVGAGGVDGPTGVLVAYAPLVLLALRFRAGVAEG